MQDLIPLTVMTAGQSGEIAHLSGLPEQLRRLRELGFRDGVTIQMVQCGNPCIVRLGNCKLCFRQCDMSCILVRPGKVA